jgi:hypothetical protein
MVEASKLRHGAGEAAQPKEPVKVVPLGAAGDKPRRVKTLIVVVVHRELCQGVAPRPHPAVEAAAGAAEAPFHQSNAIRVLQGARERPGLWRSLPLGREAAEQAKNLPGALAGSERGLLEDDVLVEEGSAAALARVRGRDDDHKRGQEAEDGPRPPR